MGNKASIAAGGLPLSEKDFRQQVLDLARVLGWECYFTWGSLHSPSGFPDLVMARLSRLIIAELKSEKGVLSEAQEKWLELLRGTGKCDVYLFRPSDWDEIVEILR